MAILNRSSEAIARFIDRRRFLKRVATTIFSATTAAVISLDQTLSAHAWGCPVGNHDPACTCNPLGAIYCHQIGEHCNGYKCPDGCKTYTGFWNNGCWCSKSCNHNGTLQYYVCCDCDCKAGPCGCRQAFKG